MNDGKGGVYEQVIAITVVNVNEAPTALALNQPAVVEDEPRRARWSSTVSVTDPDNADAYSTPDTFTMAFAGADAVYFVFDGLQIKVAPGGLPTAETKS